MKSIIIIDGRMVCIPSSSWITSPELVPWAMLQYCEGVTGMFVLRKYLFSTSIVAVEPPRRAMVHCPVSWRFLCSRVSSFSHSSTAMSVSSFGMTLPLV